MDESGPKVPRRHPEKALPGNAVQTYTKPGRYADGAGLFLVVDPSGAKRWGQRLVIRGKRTDLGLGSCRDVTLAQARTLAAKNRQLARAGGDPLAEKRARADVPTFEEAAAAYMRKVEAEARSAKHAAQWASTLATYAGPVIGKLRVDQVTRQDVLRVLTQDVRDKTGAVVGDLWTARTETASRLRGRIEAVLSWATVSGHRAGDNPARWAGNLEQLLPKPGKVADRGHHPALALGDVPRWWRMLSGREGMGARALQFVALTWARSGEVRGATWAEIDLEAGVWTIPAARMKAEREHRVALSPAAVALLRGLPRFEGNDLVFPAVRGGQLSDMTVSAVMRRMHADDLDLERGGFFDPKSGRPAVPHGIRSTARDWVSERTSFPGDMAEVALAHRISNAVEAAYRRGDQLEKRRAMMAAWADVLEGRTGGDVVPLRRA